MYRKKRSPLRTASVKPVGKFFLHSSPPGGPRDKAGLLWLISSPYDSCAGCHFRVSPVNYTT